MELARTPMIAVVVIAFATLGAGCSGERTDFPIVDEPDKSFEASYKVCEDPVTGARIYESSYSGDDSGWASFYDEAGKLIESTPEMGPGALNNLRPNTKVENCIRTTEKYFRNNVTTE